MSLKLILAITLACTSPLFLGCTTFSPEQLAALNPQIATFLEQHSLV